MDLNDWFRFDRAGRYRFYLKSHRLKRERPPGEPGSPTIAFAAVSNVVEIQIADDAAWRARKLEELRAAFDRGAGDTAPEWRELRYLGTSGAIELAFQDARHTGNGPDTLLLVGARDRPQMLAALDRYLADSHVGIREWDIRVRALFTMLQKEAPTPFPMFGWQMPDEAELRRLQAVVQARQDRYDEILRAEAVRLIPVVEQKETEAREISRLAIAAAAPAAAKAAGLVPPEDYGLSRAELLAQFAAFEPERQHELLGTKWDLVRGPGIIPALEEVIGKKAADPLLPGESLVVWGVGTTVADAALRRLMELAPDEAARILRNDIASGGPRFVRIAVREVSSPGHSGGGRCNLSVIECGCPGRVALGREVRDCKPGRSDACALRTRVVVLCGRGTIFDLFCPHASRRRSAGPAAARHDSPRTARCYRSLLNQVGAIVWNAAIEAQAIATLDDSDPDAVLSAAQALSAHGSAEVESPLWKRLERWSERWRGRAAELEVPSNHGKRIERGESTRVRSVYGDRVGPRLDTR